MKRILSILIGIMLITTLGLASASCAPTPIPAPAPTPAPTPTPTPTPSPGIATGTLEIHVTDAPPREEVTSILVTVAKVEIHKAVAEQQGGGVQVQQQIQQGEGEWLSINITEDANPFDLLLIAGLDEVLAVSEVEVGKYTQIRLTIENIEVALGDGVLQPATVPSGELKFVRPFDVVDGEVTEILFDFEAEKSVNITGAGKILVRPVVKLTVKQGGSVSPGEGIRVVSEEESRQIAEEFLRNSPTFVFDGIEDTLRLSDNITLKCPNCWEFIFEFDSSHAGYGDRTGQILAQVITPHQAAITVEQGEVTRAVMDDKWDMIEQEELSQPEAETGEQVSVDASYDGEEVKIAVGDLLIVTLASNPTTGFKWELTEVTDQTVLELVEQKFEAPGAGAPVGAGGEEVWTFKALDKGKSTISMEYRRSWEQGVEPDKTFVLTVVVK